MGRNEISLPGIEGNIILRHGWGGDLKLRNRMLQERSYDTLELREHPYAEAKFYDAQYHPSSEDHALLQEMLKAFEG